MLRPERTADYGKQVMPSPLKL